VGATARSCDEVLVTSVGQVEASGIMKLFEGLIIQQAEKQDQNNYDRLKAILEAA
jgi:hypothetical protein